jgi:hypothetical protein
MEKNDAEALSQAEIKKSDRGKNNELQVAAYNLGINCLSTDFGLRSPSLRRGE